MKRIVERSVLGVAVLVCSAAPIFAGHRWGGGYTVPEIDASSGVLAIAAVLATLAFVAERRRRAA